MTARRWVAPVVGALVVLLTSCGVPAPTTSDVFDGLDPAVVAEVMDDPVAWGKVLDEDDATRRSMAQGIVRNFQQCRAAYAAYRSWLTDGPPPAVPDVSVPAHPLEPADTAIRNTQVRIEDAITSGDPALLRDLLVGDARCGEWIPAEARDRDGGTIADAVRTLPPLPAESNHAAPDDPSLLDAAGVLAEFWEATAGYELPAGATFDAPDVPVSEPLPGGTLAPAGYEVDNGRTLAVAQWTCAWERRWLDVRSDDPEAAAAALAELTTILDDPVFLTLYDTTAQEQVRELLTRAGRDDPTPVADDVATNCRA